MRPSVSVIVPFAGPQSQLDEMLRRLATLELRDGDEAIVVDNRRAAPSASARSASAPTPSTAAAGDDDHDRSRVRVMVADELASSWHARNAGARSASGEWLLFIDADTRPGPHLLDRYFEPPPGADVAVLAGAIRDWMRTDTLCSRYVAARQKMDEQTTLSHPYAPYAQTANCAVRRDAFDAVGGFTRAVTGGDADLCWRLRAAGWELETRLAAVVEHENRSRFRDLFAQMAQHGSGLEWLERRYPGAAPRPGPRALLGRVPHYLLAAARARSREESLFALVDCVSLYARDAGRLRQRER